MSSQSEDDSRENAATNRAKRRVVQRVVRACDLCRRKKVRCDGGIPPDSRCSSCVANGQECTYIETTKKRNPPKAYVESLEARLKHMEQLLEGLRPSKESDPQVEGARGGEAVGSPNLIASSSRSGSFPSVRLPASASPPVEDDEDDSLTDDELKAREGIAKRLEALSISPFVKTSHSSAKFFGKSSSYMLYQTAHAHKRTYLGVSESEAPLPVFSMRPEFTVPHPWVSRMAEISQQNLVFPEPDLMFELVDLYFKRLNVMLPLLHRPTFEMDIAAGLHTIDERFGLILLAVCAIGARFSDDTRVFIEEINSEHSAGWKWFKQVQNRLKLVLLEAPGLYDMQLCCLCGIFMHGSSIPQPMFGLIGMGLRMAQDMGLHRKNPQKTPPTIRGELLKRGFWVLIWLDRMVGSGLGRPPCVQDEDIDAELPIECDDEYWAHEDPQQAFRQPPGVPSYITYFNCSLRLFQIEIVALRTLYCINKSKSLLGFSGPNWMERVVVDLDSELNKWIDSIPDHLRWNPHNDNMLFFNQSAMLYASYYGTQIMLHRPFIPLPNKTSSHAFPSLAICTNAARSCIRVLDVQRKRTGHTLYIPMAMPLFISGIILLMNIWTGKRSGIAVDPVKEMGEVQKAIDTFGVLEHRWFLCGRLSDFLRELASLGDLSLPEAQSRSKRGRDDDEVSTNSTPPQPSASVGPTKTDRLMAGTRRVSQASQNNISPSPQQDQLLSSTSDFLQWLNSQGGGTTALPIGSDELGRLPIHPTSGGGNTVPQIDSWFTLNSANTPSSVISSNSSQQSPLISPFGPQPEGVSFYTDSVISNGMGGSTYGQSQSIPFMTQIPHGGDATMLPSTGVTPTVPNISDNTLSMWSSAPSGFDWNEWVAYLNDQKGDGINVFSNPFEMYQSL